ncbi:uncharacterized protein [Dysidea avara]|uniref:uncharacterized protein isoform X2 n=1 Tax=Dysidea avara TaxID=196820 RepID=UPI0033229152
MDYSYYVNLFHFLLYLGSIRLDRFLDNITSQKRDSGCRYPRYIQLSLTANTYQLNITKFVHGVDLKENDTLMVEGEGAYISCTGVDGVHASNLYLSIARASMVVFDGLVFTGCLRPIFVEEVKTVVIQNCAFLNMKNGAVNIYNSPNVLVRNCTFYNNTSDGSEIRTLQTSSGGLSISYNSVTATSVNITVTNCGFINNVAASVNDLQSTFAQSLFVGKGGGLAIVVNTSSVSHCIVSNSKFINNTASIFGGALYCVTVKAYDDQTFLFENITFEGNTATQAGAIGYGLVPNRNKEALYSVVVCSCTFINNIAGTAGATHITLYGGLTNNSVTFKQCTFTNNSATNFAGTVDIVFHNFYADRSSFFPIAFVNCLFDSNFGAEAAAINIAYYNARFDNVTFRNNIGTTVQMIAGRVHVEGSIIYDGNNAITDASKGIVSEGGALHLRSFSQIQLHNGTHVKFINNTGRVGASVVVDADHSTAPSVFRNTLNLCFLQYSDPSVPFDSLNPDQVSINFMGNTAVVGGNVYTKVEFCPWLPPLYNRNSTNVLGLSFITSDSYKMNSSPLLTPTDTIELLNESVSAYPGESLELLMILKDELSQTTLGIVTFESNTKKSPNSNDAVSYILINPTARVLLPRNLKFNITYSLGSIDDASKVNMTFPIKVDVFHSPDKSSYFNLTVTTCPAGHSIQALMSVGDMKRYECICHKDHDVNIVNCAPNERRLVLQEGLWAININTGESLNGMIEYYQCPPGYCQCSREDDGGNICNSVYYYDNDDLQCVCDRQGYLCGKCRGNKGVSVLLNKCVSCGHGSIALIFGLVVVDIIVITVILLSSVTIFSWLYPVVFYVQITPYIAQYFPVTFSAVQPYLHYISSAASLYFPYDFCIYPGMTALVSYSLRYIPVLLFSIIYCCIWVLNRKFLYISISWSGVWLLILLFFTDVVNTSVSILNCPILRDSDGHRSRKWFVDGTVECFSGGHAGLATFAILVLIVCTLLIIALVVVVMGKVKAIKGCLRLRLWTISFEKLLQEPFVDRYNWWAPTELIRRLLFIILITAFPGNLIPVMLLVMISVAIYMYIQPYQGLWTNILEVVLLGDILLMVIISSTDHFKTTAVFDSDHSFCIDQCGKVDQISEHAAVLIPFYFLPIIILFGLVGKEVATKVKRLHLCNSRKIIPKFSSKDQQSTLVITRPKGNSYLVNFNAMKEMTLALLTSHHEKDETDQ